MSTTSDTDTAHVIDCADCGIPIVMDGSAIVHRDGCAAGLSLDDVVLDDTTWLHDHPLAPERWRGAQLPELLEVLAAGFDITRGRWRVCVRRHPVGITRMICTNRAAVLWVVDTAAR